MNRKKIELILLVILISVHIFCNFIWINSNSNALIFQGKSWQKNINIYLSLENNLADFRQPNNKTNFEKFYNLILVSPYSPPFYFWAASLVDLAIGKIFPQPMLLCSTLFLIFLIIIVYKMGEYLSEASGMMSAFICSLYPYIYLSSRYFNMALGVGVMVTLSIYLLLKSEMFQKKAYSVLLGICLGLGMLTKYTFFVFLIGPVAAVLFEIFTKRKNDNIWAKRRNNILVSFAIAVAISGVYYFNCSVMGLLFIRGFNLDQGALNMTIMQRGLFYLRMLIVKEIGLATAIYTIGLTVLFFRNKFVFKKTMSLWIFLSFILVVLTPKKSPQPEYIIPLLPAFALISGIAINKIRKNIVKYSIALSLGVIMLVHFFQPYSQEHAFCFSKEATEIKNIFLKIGEQRTKVGYICPSRERNEFLGINLFLSLWSPDLAEVYDFFVSPVGFSENLENFDFLFYVSCGNEKWPNTECLINSLDQYCTNQGISLIWDDKNIGSFDGRRLVFSKQAAGEIVDVIGKFEIIDHFYFSPRHLVQGPYLKINVFRKKNHDFLSPIKDISPPGLPFNLFTQAINRSAFFNALDSVKILKHVKEPLSSFSIIDRVYSKKYGFNFEQVRDKLIFSELIDMARQSRGNRQYADALEILKKTLSYDFDNDLVFEELDQVFIAWKQPEKAISFYNGLAGVFPDSKEVFLRLSRQYKILEDYENVGKYYRRVLEVDPNCQEAKKWIINSEGLI